MLPEMVKKFGAYVWGTKCVTKNILYAVQPKMIQRIIATKLSQFSQFVCVNEMVRNQQSTRLIWHTAITIDSCIYFMRNKRLLKDLGFYYKGLKWTLFILTKIMIIVLFALHFNVSSLQMKLQMYIIHISTLTAVPHTLSCIIKSQNCFVINWMLSKVKLLSSLSS